MVHEIPASILYPTSINDIETLIKFAHNNSAPFTIAARGQGHSVRGQAMAPNGVVVNMRSLKNHRNGFGITVSGTPSMDFFYADVGGEQLWVDVLNATLEHGLAPVSFTDYLYLTVGGTLSNAGISGQTFRYGPQISNVYEMDVITGEGDFVTCSPEKNRKLFYAVLGGLGQFGIIVRARIALEPAPKRVKWVRMLYNDFSAFTKDQESLISLNGRKQKNALNYLEGLLLMDKGTPENWRSTFFPLSDHSRIISHVTKYGIIYCIEVAKYYDDHTLNSVDKELQVLFEGLSFIPGFTFEKDISYIDFLNRAQKGEQKLQSQGLWDIPHPWLNLFVPKSHISDFNSIVFKDIVLKRNITTGLVLVYPMNRNKAQKGEQKLQSQGLWDIPHPWLNLFVPKSHISDFNSIVFKDIVLKRNITTGLVLVYPMNRNKWDDRMSAVIPDEDVFYTIGFLHGSGFNDWETIDLQNKDILQSCYNAGIEVTQYLPNYKTTEDWKNHFGMKWRTFQERKAQFDPKMILSPGQRIFNNN
nr:cytokinin dehydrogenase 6 [Quercus suber]